MELRQLEYLVAVVEEKNFTRAAERLHVAQPGVSAQVRQLERELGHTLLDRSARTVRPTEAGAAVLAHARAALAAVAQVRIALDEVDGLLRGHVAVGTIATADPISLPDSLADFHQEHPGIEITLTEDSSQRLVENLLNGTLDVAVIGLTGTIPPGLAAETITDRPLAALLPREHPLARHRSLPLECLAGEPLMTMPVGSGIRDALDTGFAAAGLRPRIAFEAGDPAVLVRLAERGLGIALLPSDEEETRQTDGLKQIVITHPGMRTCLALAWRENPTPGPAAATLVDHLRARIPEQSPSSAASPRRA